MRAGYIAGIVFGILAIFFGCLTIYLIWRRHKQQHAMAASARSRQGHIIAPSVAQQQEEGRAERTSRSGGEGKDGVDTDVDGEPWPSRKAKKGRGGHTEMPPPAPGPFSYL
ncbi:hypothetical protein BDZ90DRAFT_258763 [Jaminaea rosea]|uniref:Uncharacterized protein n=1 Tax=Jaminaea rosea TaxID=1569628 RepID=A0A316UXA3_9BASI|nr:hypothetical protein BDZ90DRAFT_258763 [Jaminaea rosea]PWN29862.1 hypothetical protein BDZ90DRAFT_258763 [Jaminaea rosea]